MNNVDIFQKELKIVALGKVDIFRFLDNFSTRKAIHILPDNKSIQVIGIRNYAFVYNKDKEEIVVSDNMFELIKYLEMGDSEEVPS